MRKCFERIDGSLKIEPETSRKVSDLAKEVANRLLVDNPDVDIWDLETLFNREFGYCYALACMREKSRSRNIRKNNFKGVNAMEDVEKICKNCEYTLGGYGIPILPDPTIDTCCYRKNATLVQKNWTCKWFKPIEKPKFNFDVPITFINWNGEE